MCAADGIGVFGLPLVAGENRPQLWRERLSNVGLVWVGNNCAPPRNDEGSSRLPYVDFVYLAPDVA